MLGWNNNHTAEMYDNYAKDYATYRETNRDLVDFAEIKKDSHIVDLACGTGMTSNAILKKLANTGHVYALDQAQAMLERAKLNIKASNLSFYLSAAENMHEVLPEGINYVLCNSAFWQLKADETLQSIKYVLAPKAQLVFNLPATFVPSISKDRESINLRRLMTIIAREEFGIDVPKQRRLQPQTLEASKALLERNGFELVRHKAISYQNKLKDSLAFCSIPIMTERTLPNVDYETRMQILEKAYEGVQDKTQTLTVTWDYFAARVSDS